MRSLFVLLMLTPLAFSQNYTITDLGLLQPTAINSWGQVVGNMNGHAYLWTRGLGFKDLGLLSGGTFSQATGVNDLDVVVGTADGPGTVFAPLNSGRADQQCDSLTQPFVWTPQGGIRAAGTLQIVRPDLWCFIRFYATGINVLGQIVGYNHDASTYQYGFVFTGSLASATLLGNSYPPSVANAINGAGQVVGQSDEANLSGPYALPGHAVSWSAGVMTDLGTLGGLDFHWASEASALNDVGQVVGWSATSPNQQFWNCIFDEPFVVPNCPVLVHAVSWSANGTITDLGTLPGSSDSIAVSVNFFGQVVGTAGNTLVPQTEGEHGGSLRVVGRPFLWTQQNGMRDLNDLLPFNSGWTLNSAAAINLWGQITGSGTINGEAHGFVLTPKVFLQH